MVDADCCEGSMFLCILDMVGQFKNLRVVCFPGLLSFVGDCADRS